MKPFTPFAEAPHPYPLSDVRSVNSLAADGSNASNSLGDCLRHRALALRAEPNLRLSRRYRAAVAYRGRRA
jgi:hypothetical protein